MLYWFLVCSPCTDDDETVVFNDLEFSITFSDNEWQAIKPKTRTYEEKHMNGLISYKNIYLCTQDFHVV